MERALQMVPELQRNHHHPFVDYTECDLFNTTNPTKVYYPYNHDVDDRGWGCAWRCIQAAIMPNTIPFPNLVQRYSEKRSLLDIYLRRKPTLETLHKLEECKWAPLENSRLWAEPFIGSLICDDLNINNQLCLVNGYPPNANAPDFVFRDTFPASQFMSKLIDHFQRRRGVVMIDDATYALNIWGCREKEEGLELLIADPHILSNQEERLTGLYRILLDNKGNQISNSVSQKEKKAFAYLSFQQVRFFEKRWMVLFVEE